MKESVIKVWEEKVVIPTYEAGKPDKNPMFFEKRVYQGSSGVIYPNPIIEKIYDEKKDKTYTALFLENQYLKIMILPELGGRVQMAYDKIKQRHFIYYNRVIKPALVGLCGPWISGGIEFNWPQHHRPSTFEPVDYSIEENEDGSKTVWVNEVERMFHTKGMAGFTLHSGKAYLEIKVKLFNRTSLPQTFLWWANPAVKVNDHYQSVFPPDVHAVFDHGKRDVSTFPIATGEYYKVNYAPGTDISRYKNIPVPTSYMAVNSAYDFVGGYEHDTQAGVLHVANHHVSPGKKQWTWGHGDFGKAWDRNLTDEDGPYIELMTGMFTDNQPDFSWLMPYEEKSFTQYFMPYRELGVVKNATKDVLVNVEKQNDGLIVKIFSTSSMAINIELKKGNDLIFKESYNSSPETVYSKTIPVSEDVSAENILLILSDHSNRELLRYDNKENSRNDIPEPAEAVAEPEDVENNEKLYLIGLHLEQYRHATYSPVPYYEEALRRDAGDIRNNNALGLWYFRRGKFVKGESYFRKAIETLVHRNPNPYDGEPYYNLGLCLKMQDRLTEAYSSFYKATWNAAWQETGYFSLAQIDMARGNYETALEHIQDALDRNAKNSKAYTLKIVALRKLKHYQDALQVCKIALEKDRFNLSVLFEQYKIYEALGDNATATQFLDQLNSLARGSQHNYIEYTLDYSGAGLYPEMIELLLFAIEKNTEPDYPMLWYYLGWGYHQSGNVSESLSCFERATKSGSDYCFPNRLEDILVLQMASTLHPSDARAPYYLGNLWYDKRQYDDAIEQWELALQRDPAFPTVLRNLGIAYFNKRNDLERSVNYYEKAFELNPTDARVLMELDQLHKRLNKDPRERLLFLEKHINVVEQRDDLYLERISLYNFLGRFELAFDLIRKRKFHPWEGGEGKISAQYIHSLVGMAKQQIQKSQYAKAIELLEQAQVYPHYLSEGKLFGASENDIFYWLACAYEGLGDDANTKICLQKATQGLSEPTAAMFYNDQQPDKIFYQGLAWKALGKKELASEIFSRLIEYGREHLNAEVKIDYFAVSLPDLLIFEDDLGIRNQTHCYYMMGLGYLGLNKKSDAKQCLKTALDKDTMHYGACIHLAMVNSKMIETVL